jgi:hypothetical protein
MSKIINHNSQIGIQGDYNNVSGNTFTQNNTDVLPDLDLVKTISELEAVIAEMKKNASSPSHYNDIALVLEAKVAAEAKDKPKLLDYLKKVGTFGLDICKDLIGDVLKDAIIG